MSWKDMWWIIGLLYMVDGPGSVLADGVVRCFCNLPECRENGYTCHSPLGKCFSQLPLGPAAPTETRHGCIESLPRDDMTSCSADGDIIKTRKYSEGDNKWPALMCCKSSMCNYFNSRDMDEETVYEGFDETYLGDKSTTTERYDLSGGSGTEQNSSGAFFQLVIIVIPIATVCILGALVFVAVRWMKDDNRKRRHRVLKEETLARVKLYVEDHFQRPHCYIADEYQVKDFGASVAHAPSIVCSSCAQSTAEYGTHVYAPINPAVFQQRTCNLCTQPEHLNRACAEHEEPRRVTKKQPCRKSQEVTRSEKPVCSCSSAKCDSAFLLASTDDGTDASVV